eukprot:591176-Prymnesium_polylepis.1
MPSRAPISTNFPGLPPVIACKYGRRVRCSGCRLNEVSATFNCSGDSARDCTTGAMASALAATAAKTKAAARIAACLAAANVL